MNKKRIMLLLLCVMFSVLLLIYIFNYRENNILKKERELAEGGEISNFIDNSDDSEVVENSLKEEGWTQRGEMTHVFNPQVYFYKDDEYSTISEDLIHYFSNALKEESLIEEIELIQADYRVVSKEEKETFELDIPEEERGLGTALYYPAIKDDTWYCVSLTEEADDIIVEHVGEDGCIVNYFFWNIMQWHKYTDVPMRSGGQRSSTPYFITWENANYMTIPFGDIKGEKIIGVTIYKYLNYIEGATIWPIVVSY